MGLDANHDAICRDLTSSPAEAASMGNSREHELHSGSVDR
jgi:hypothetical protein